MADSGSINLQEFYVSLFPAESYDQKTCRICGGTGHNRRWKLEMHYERKVWELVEVVCHNCKGSGLTGALKEHRG